MLDQSRGKGGFLSHPSRGAYDVSPSSSTLCLPDTAELYEKGSLQQFKELKQTLLRTSTQAGTGGDPRVTACRETVASAYVALQKYTKGQCCVPNRDQFLATFPGITSVFHSSEDESSQAGAGFVNEDTDDREALLSCSDEEEKSSGSEPSELICHFGPAPPLVVNNSSCEREPTRKRNRGCEELDEDEVYSRLDKRQNSDETDAFRRFSSPDTGSAQSQPQRDGPNPGEDSCVDQSADELQMLSDDFGFEMPDQQCSCCRKEGGGDAISSGSAKQSRRQKFKATVKLLREAIPGGDCMDTAIVLDEAIHYVKLLQLQVQTLGARRLAQRAAGLPDLSAVERTC